MSVVIDWEAFFRVFVAALVGATAIVTFYALGLRMLVRSGRAPVVGPAEFTDAIAVVTEKELKKAAKQAAKAARKSPLSAGQKRLAFIAACGCFAICGLAVLSSILLITLG